MNSIVRPASIALGVTTLCLQAVTGPLVSSTHIAIYHCTGRAASIFIPVVLNFCVLWACLTALLWLAHRSKRVFIPLWWVIGVALPCVLARTWTLLAGGRLSFLAYVATLILPSLLVLVVALLARRTLSDVFGQIQHLIETILAFSSLLGVLVLAQLLWFGWTARNLNSPPAFHQRLALASPHPPRPRIIWILLDELSFQQIDEERFPGLALPAFDRLAAESTLFTDVIPAGSDTAQVIPTLFTGIAVDGLDITSSGQLRALHNAQSNSWNPFDPRATVFQDALDLGYSTSVAGWYNPYCRILPAVLDRCFWSFRAPYRGHMSVNHSTEDNFLSPARAVLQNASYALFRRGATTQLDLDRRSMHIADYKDLLAAGDAQLNDSASNFLFLHMPVPHPGGIYDHRRHALTTARSSYIDNLALADQYLAHVRALLEQRHEWDSSVVLIMGDHSWRTRGLWEKSTDWTPDDQAASHGGQFDSRPYYLVRLPGQHSPQRLTAPFAALRTRSLVDAILRQRVHTPADLAAWTAAP